ncbi:MAG: RNA 2',3'-cyclic phosphodiesterase [Candidatus Nealsonbacteria bacterium]
MIIFKNMMHRIFIAINLPEDVKNQLANYQKKIEGLFQPPSPIRWTKKESLHITLEFLGNLSDDEVMKVCQDTEEFAKKHKPFMVTLDKISYGPPKKIPPRMIWITGEKIPELNLTPHITLGRIKMWEWRGIEPEERPEVLREIGLGFEINSLEVMESRLKKAGPNYTILESCPLQKK